MGIPRLNTIHTKKDVCITMRVDVSYHILSYQSYMNSQKKDSLDVSIFIPMILRL